MATKTPTKRDKTPRNEPWAPYVAGDRDLHDVGTEPSMDGIEMVRSGIPAELLEMVARRMDVSLEKLYEILSIPRSTADRQRKKGGPLNAEHTERVMGLLRLVAKTERMVRESGDPTGFDAWIWMARWIVAPNGALGGRTPADFLDTADGRTLVMDFLSQMQSGAYA